jgi:ankyrin repeat protein
MALHLLEHGADPNIFNINGQTALMNAAKRGNVTILEKLLSRGDNFTKI